MIQDFMKSKLPHIVKKGDKDAYLDLSGVKRLITSEETVIQHLISYLIENLQIPIEMIYIEDNLKNYGINSNERADIIINYEDDNKEIYPLAVIECKAPEVNLDDKAFNQVCNYADKLNCNYCWLTNGEESFYFYYDGFKNHYVGIEKFPTYSELLQGKYFVANDKNFLIRIDKITRKTTGKLNILLRLLKSRS